MVDVVNLPTCMSPERATGLTILPLNFLGGVVSVLVSIICILKIWESDLVAVFHAGEPCQVIGQTV